MLFNALQLIWIFAPLAKSCIRHDSYWFICSRQPEGKFPKESWQFSFSGWTVINHHESDHIPFVFFLLSQKLTALSNLIMLFEKQFLWRLSRVAILIRASDVFLPVDFKAKMNVPLPRLFSQLRIMILSVISDWTSTLSGNHLNAVEEHYCSSSVMAAWHIWTYSL